MVTIYTASLTFNNSIFYPHSVSCVDLRTNSDYFPIQHLLTGFYNPDGQCLLRGTDWVFIYNLGVPCFLPSQNQLCSPFGPVAMNSLQSCHIAAHSQIKRGPKNKPYELIGAASLVCSKNSCYRRSLR